MRGDAYFSVPMVSALAEMRREMESGVVKRGPKGGIQQGTVPLKRCVAMAVPAGSQLLVANTGDPRHVTFDGVTARWFPETSVESFTGDALALLEEARRAGAEYFLVPAAAAGWLERDVPLREHLESAGSMVGYEPGVCVLYALNRVTLQRPAKTPRATAILSVRNEERHIGGCIEHYVRQGMEIYLIDNDSTDRTRAIAETFLGRGVTHIERFPFNGLFEFRAMNRRKEAIIAGLDTDWILYTDADEYRHSPIAGWTLPESFGAVEAAGYNAVNFLEFVYVPVREAPMHEPVNYRETMRWYYFFMPRCPYHVSAWKKTPTGAPLEISPHRTTFDGLRLCPQFFVMSHYHFLSVVHGAEKYGTRRHDAQALAKGDHGGPKGWRENYTGWPFELPAKSELSEAEWDLAHWWRKHWIELAVGKAKAGE